MGIKRVFFLVYILTFISVYALNFSIAPTKFQVDLDKIETQEAYIINNTSTPLRIEVYLDVAQGYEGRDLNSNIVFFPKLVSVKPGGRQSVRFRLKDIEELKKGEYKSLLVFREKPQQIKKIDKSEEKEVTTEFNFITEVAIGIKGEKK